MHTCVNVFATYELESITLDQLFNFFGSIDVFSNIKIKPPPSSHTDTHNKDDDT